MSELKRGTRVKVFDNNEWIYGVVKECKSDLCTVRIEHLQGVINDSKEFSVDSVFPIDDDKIEKKKPTWEDVDEMVNKTIDIKTPVVSIDKSKIGQNSGLLNSIQLRQIASMCDEMYKVEKNFNPFELGISLNDMVMNITHQSTGEPLGKVIFSEDSQCVFKPCNK